MILCLCALMKLELNDHTSNFCNEIHPDGMIMSVPVLHIFETPLCIFSYPSNEYIF